MYIYNTLNLNVNMCNLLNTECHTVTVNNRYLLSIYF